MPDSNNILINDSCILFDLIDLNLIDDFFCLEYSFFTTGHVIAEIKDETQISTIEKYLSIGLLKVDNSGSLDSIELLYDLYNGLSYTDSSVLELAIKNEKGVLLSSDKKLRNISKSKNLEVRGFLWIIYKLAEDRIISVHKAMEVLNKYPKVNEEAPIKEIKKLEQILNNLKL